MKDKCSRMSRAKMTTTMTTTMMTTTRLCEPLPTALPLLPDVIRLTVQAQYGGEDWDTFSAAKTATEVATCLLDRYPHLAAVTLSDDGDGLRVIERPSFDSPVERYRICGVAAEGIRCDRDETDTIDIRLVRLGCDDPGPDEDDEPDETGEETQPVIATETPPNATADTADAAADEAALAAASVPPRRGRKAPAAAPPAPGALAVTVAQAELRRSLAAVCSAAAGGRGILPITANVLLDATPEGLRVACTDLEVALAATIPAQAACRIDSPGAFTVPAATLLALVERLPSEPVTLAHEADGAALTLRCGAARSRLKGIDATDFPEIAEHDSGTGAFTLPAATLAQGLDLVKWAVTPTSDKTRPVLGCVHVQGGPGARDADGEDRGTLRLAAATGATLALWTGEVESVPPCSVLVPRAGVAALDKLLSGLPDDAPATLAFLPTPESPNLLRCTVESAGQTHSALIRLAEGVFPDVERVVPTGGANVVTVGRVALLALLRQAAVVATRVESKDGVAASQLVRLVCDPQPGRVTVRGLDAERGEHEGSVPAEVLTSDGAPLSFAVSAPYLLSALAPCTGDTARLSSAGALLPLLVQETALPTYRAVVMPMHEAGQGGSQ